MEKYILDRFEGAFAVLEKDDKTTINIEKSLLDHAKEGDVIIFDANSYVVDEAETMLRKERIKEKMERLFKRR